MTAVSLLDQIQHLENLIEVYGDVLIGWELRQPPESIVPVLADAGRFDVSQVHTLLDEILIGGGARLFADFRAVDAAAREGADANVLRAVERVREALLHIGRYNADALVWGLGSREKLRASLDSLRTDDPARASRDEEPSVGSK